MSSDAIHSRLPPAGIDRWIPSRWNQVIGNRALVNYFRDMLWALRVRGDAAGSNTLVIGKSRSGKTSTIKLFLRGLLCADLDPQTLNPCDGGCDPCHEDHARYGDRGVFVNLAGRTIHYLPIDCTAITEADLRSQLVELRDYDGIRVVYLDETHRLVRRAMDEQLLKPVEERNFLWLASCATTGELEQMFTNRFVKVRTELPDQEELAIWLAQRCDEWRLSVDEPETLYRLADRAQGIPGLALQVLNRASKTRDQLLTSKTVADHIFDTQE